MFGIKLGGATPRSSSEQVLPPALQNVSIGDLINAARQVRTLPLDAYSSQFVGLVPATISGWNQAIGSYELIHEAVMNVRRRKAFETYPDTVALLAPILADMKAIRTVMSQRLAWALVQKMRHDPRLVSLEELCTHLAEFNSGLAGHLLGGTRFKPASLARKSRKELAEIQQNVIDALEAWARKSDEYLSDGEILNLPTNESALQNALDLLAAHAKEVANAKQSAKRREQAAKNAILRREQKAIEDADAALAKEVAEKLAAQNERECESRERLRFYFAAGRAAASLGLSDLVTVDQKALSGAEPTVQELLVLAPDPLSAADAKVVAALSLTGVKIQLLVRDEISEQAGRWMPKDSSQNVHVVEDQYYTDILPSEVSLSEPLAFGLGLAIGSSYRDNWMLVDGSVVDSIEPDGGAVCVLVAGTLTVDVVRSCISVLAAGRSVTLVARREIADDVQLWLDKAPDMSITYLPEISLAGYKAKSTSARAHAQESTSAHGAEVEFALFSQWQDSLALIANRGRVQVVNSSETLPSATSSYAEHCPASETDPLLWLSSQDDDWEKLNGETKEYVIEMAQVTGTEIAIAYGSETGTYPPFVTCNGTSALGNNVVARVTGCDAGGRLGIRVGVPVGFVTRPEDYVVKGGVAQLAAGWLGFKMRNVTMQVLDATADQDFIRSKNVDALTGALLTPGEMLADPIVRPWFCVSPSGVDESGHVICMRGGAEAPVGQVEANDLVLCLYVGLELLVGIDPETDSRFLDKVADALSVALDAVTVCEGLVEELGVVPFSMP